MKNPKYIKVYFATEYDETELLEYLEDYNSDAEIKYENKINTNYLKIWARTLYYSLEIMSFLELKSYTWEIHQKKVPIWIGIEGLMEEKILIGINLEGGNTVEQYNELNDEWYIVNRFSVRYGEEQQVFDKNNNLT